jgi:hypothetical protein
MIAPVPKISPHGFFVGHTGVEQNRVKCNAAKSLDFHLWLDVSQTQINQSSLRKEQGKITNL